MKYNGSIKTMVADGNICENVCVYSGELSNKNKLNKELREIAMSYMANNSGVTCPMWIVTDENNRVVFQGGIFFGRIKYMYYNDRRGHKIRK